MTNFAGLDSPFWLALGRSVLVGVIVAGLSLGIGWPLGVRVGLTTFPWRRFLLALLALPLLLPSFLVAIGLSTLWRGLGGVTAVVWAFACLGVPLVSFAALAATLTLTRGQADAARLAGRSASSLSACCDLKILTRADESSAVLGERHLFRLALRAAFPLAGLAAALAGALTLADPGPGQIFGWPGAASELLTSFAARYDRALATRQALALAVVAALIAWPLAWKLAPEVAAGLFARDVNRPSPVRASATTVWVFGAASLSTLFPLAGLLRPLITKPWPVARAWSEVVRTGTDTLLYAALAASIAVAVAFALVWVVGCSAGPRRWLVAAAVALLALPPALPALWLVPWSGRMTLGIALALRGLPLAILLALRAVGSMPPSWADAARVHRVPRVTFLARAALPWCARWAFPAAAIAALLATAEVGTVLLLHPPGHGSLPLAVFTIMANAPEALVAVLCLFYLALALALAVTGQQIIRRL
jgi:iron(III) transport system permease protein